MVFRPTRTKFRNVLTGFTFVGELTEMGAEGDVRLIRTMHIEDGIRVVIEDLFPEEFQGFVQPLTCPAGGKGRNEHIGVDIEFLTLVLGTVVHFHPVLIEATDLPNVMLVGVHEELER